MNREVIIRVLAVNNTDLLISVGAFSSRTQCDVRAFVTVHQVVHDMSDREPLALVVGFGYHASAYVLRVNTPYIPLQFGVKRASLYVQSHTPDKAILLSSYTPEIYPASWEDTYCADTSCYLL